MTGKERMMAGKSYLPFDPELAGDRLAARRILHRFNNNAPGEQEMQASLLRELLGSCGDDAYIEPPFRCDYGYNIHVGAQFYANFGCVILDCGPVHIGDRVLFGPQVQVYPVGHPLDPVLRAEGHEFAKAVTIGNDVWIGGGSIILPGVCIGDGAVIGAGSVVTRHIPPRVLAAGNPCRVVREITEADRAAFERDYLDA